MEKSVFDLWIYNDLSVAGGRRFPRREYYGWKEGTASSLIDAEKMIAYEVKLSRPIYPPHSFLVREIPLDRICCKDKCLASYLYDRKGVRIDQRTFSTIPEDNGVFPGRAPEQIRFKKGDIVEYKCGKFIELGTVVDVPPSIEMADQINSNPKGRHMDETDDRYTVIGFDCEKNYARVDAMDVFEPSYKIPPGVRNRLVKAYNDYITLPTRIEILNTTAQTQLMDFFERHGMKGRVQGVKRLSYDKFKISIELPDGPKELSVESKKVFKYIDRVCCTLARLAGIKVEGRGYKILKDEDGDLSF